jgi:hypothetical protein
MERANNKKGEPMSDLIKRGMSFQTTDGRTFEVLYAAQEHQRNIDLLDGLTKVLGHSIKTGQADAVVRGILYKHDEIRELLIAHKHAA